MVANNMGGKSCLACGLAEFQHRILSNHILYLSDISQQTRIHAASFVLARYVNVITHNIWLTNKTKWTNALVPCVESVIQILYMAGGRVGERGLSPGGLDRA